MEYHGTLSSSGYMYQPEEELDVGERVSGIEHCRININLTKNKFSYVFKKLSLKSLLAIKKYIFCTRVCCSSCSD